ncbi:hypothetical protein SAMN05444278_1181 [Psychroflexus salarius]|uniref:Uncharacterized protein n=1 Tax=Psychroflexus salarius TaxID=1155689 RepID=A0A1M4Y923_9FLAO|nr:hypothetical protein [Psychroflexus salarius]SHF02251.1 hypothetical protein SAMN05444278_1181 [Psychroflexus salarius]
MTKKDFLSNLGFIENPFQHTNADKESSIIDKYFIYPDYFEDVWGDPENPISNIIYAPRGGGKTAQRVMIEKRAVNFKEILTITYTEHDLSNFNSIDEVKLSYHLEYLNRLLLLAFFDKLSNLQEFEYKNEFSYSERQYLYKLCKIYLYNTPASFPKQAINSLKTITDRATEIWDRFKAPFSEIIKKISKEKGVEIDLSKVDIDEKIKSSHKDNFLNLRVFLERLGYSTIYILIDKVDEQSLTGNDPKASYKFISELLKDLELLETEGIAFKFFLWDELQQYCSKDARPDRVFSYQLEWKVSQIKEMLNKRLSAFSNNIIKDSFSLFSKKKSLGRVIIFSEFSPRDCIRICNRILSEQLKENPKSLKFEYHIVNKSIDMFSKEKVEEMFYNQNNLRYLSKTNSVSFTINDLVNNKVAGDAAAIRNVILPWTKSEVLKKIGLVKRKSKKAVNEYAFFDIRVARYACPSLDLNSFISKKIRRCVSEECKEFAYRDFDKKNYDCIKCNTLLIN